MIAARTIVPIALVILSLLSGCGAPTHPSAAREPAMIYEVHRLTEPMTIDANWDKPFWQGIEPLTLGYHMGEMPAHLPKTQAKLLYDDEAIYVIFRVEDRYVRAVAERHQGLVCRDSCAEFFFAPGDDVSQGYFNLEMNCGGTMLYHFQVIPRKDQVHIKESDLARVVVAHTMPRTVEPEIAAPTTWVIEYRLPTDTLGDYHPNPVRPAPGVTWRANFFKCADATSHPHWLTWSFVDRPRPDFHVPEYFGTLRFK